MIKVLIVDDSLIVQAYLRWIFNADPDINVVGIAKDGNEAIALAMEKQPDVITMDIQMPLMDGLTATRRIMETNPKPILIFGTGWQPNDVEKSFSAMSAGAVALIEKPPGPGHPEHHQAIVSRPICASS